MLNYYFKCRRPPPYLPLDLQLEFSDHHHQRALSRYTNLQTRYEGCHSCPSVTLLNSQRRELHLLSSGGPVLARKCSNHALCLIARHVCRINKPGLMS